MTETTALRVLVTGATGFVGHALVPALAARGHIVRAATRWPETAVEGAAECVAVGEIDGTTDWREAVAGCDAVIHLAARAHVLDDRDDPTPLFQAVNRAGTAGLARAARDAGVTRFILISTIGVHGLASGPEGFTAASPIAPTTPYAISKAGAEADLVRLCEGGTMHYVIVRPPLVYGPDAKGNFARLVSLVARGLPLPLGAVKNRRSMIGLDNLVDVLALCLVHPAAADRAFVVADTEVTSTTELVRRIGSALGRTPVLLPVPAAPMRGTARLLGRTAMAEGLFGDLVVDAAETREVLGWTPPVPQAEGVARAVRGD